MKKERDKLGLFEQKEIPDPNFVQSDDPYKDGLLEVDNGIRAPTIEEVVYPYLNDAQMIAMEVVREAGINPYTLFDTVENDVVECPDEFAALPDTHYDQIDRDKLQPETKQALDVLYHFEHRIKRYFDRSTSIWELQHLFDGFELAMRVEQLKANRKFRRPVESRRGSDRGPGSDSGKRPRHSDEEVVRVVADSPSRKVAANRLNIGERGLRKRLQKGNLRQQVEKMKKQAGPEPRS